MIIIDSKKVCSATDGQWSVYWYVTAGPIGSGVCFLITNYIESKKIATQGSSLAKERWLNAVESEGFICPNFFRSGLINQTFFWKTLHNPGSMSHTSNSIFKVRRSKFDVQRSTSSSLTSKALFPLTPTNFVVSGFTKRRSVWDFTSKQVFD